MFILHRHDELFMFIPRRHDKLLICYQSVY